nr:immunoglobulin light chain junction region [Macaca mulatta]
CQKHSKWPQLTF